MQVPVARSFGMAQTQSPGHSAVVPQKVGTQCWHFAGWPRKRPPQKTMVAAVRMMIRVMLSFLHPPKRENVWETGSGQYPGMRSSGPMGVF